MKIIKDIQIEWQSFNMNYHLSFYFNNQFIFCSVWLQKEDITGIYFSIDHNKKEQDFYKLADITQKYIKNWIKILNALKPKI